MIQKQALGWIEYSVALTDDVIHVLAYISGNKPRAISQHRLDELRFYVRWDGKKFRSDFSKCLHERNERTRVKRMYKLTGVTLIELKGNHSTLRSIQVER
jgi:hypothetical protein